MVLAPSGQAVRQPDRGSPDEDQLPALLFTNGKPRAPQARTAPPMTRGHRLINACKMACSTARAYLPFLTSSFISPYAFRTAPVPCCTRPLTSCAGSPVALPATSLSLPFTFSATPFTWSLFMQRLLTVVPLASV